MQVVEVKSNTAALTRSLCAIAAFLLCVSLAAAPVALASQYSWYLKPGRIIRVNRLRMSMYCHGSGSPTVIFDSGIEESAAEWALVQPNISRSTRTCSYDRAGYGFSDEGQFPRTANRIAEELHTLLIQAGEKGPFILVGHSFGGVDLRIFATRFPAQVAGLVLDDSENEEFNFALAPPSDVDAFVASEQKMLWKCAVLAKASWRAAAGQSKQQCLGQMFRGLPEKRFSRELNRVLISQASEFSPYETASSELSNFTLSGLRTTLSERHSLGCIPLYVLTAGHHPGLPAPLESRWRLFAKDFLALSSLARQIFVGDSGHAIELDQPGVVIDTIRTEVILVRRRVKKPPSRCAGAPKSD